MIRILLAEESADIRSALRLFLETRLDLELINEVRDMEPVLGRAEDSHPARA